MNRDERRWERKSEDGNGERGMWMTGDRKVGMGMGNRNGDGERGMRMTVDGKGEMRMGTGEKEIEWGLGFGAWGFRLGAGSLGLVA